MKIDLTDIRNMVLESCNKLLLEISNNAIETMIKTSCPDLKDYMNYTLQQLSCLDFMGIKRTKELKVTPFYNRFVFDSQKVWEN